MARTAQWADSAALVVSLAAMLIWLTKKEGAWKTGAEARRGVAIEPLQKQELAGCHPFRAHRSPNGWPAAALHQSAEDKQTRLTGAAVYAATQDVYLGADLAEEQDQAGFKESWEDQCRLEEPTARAKEEMDCRVNPEVRRRLKRRKMSPEGDQSCRVWGNRLLLDPRVRNDCFFEAVSQGLQRLGNQPHVSAKRLRNLVASDHKKGSPERLRAIAGGEGLSPTGYCKALRGSMWGGLPEADLIVKRYEVKICTWSAGGSTLYQIGHGHGTIHLGLHEGHYVLLSKGFGPEASPRKDPSSTRGGAKGSEAKSQKKGKKEEDKRVQKIEKTAKRISKAVKEDLAKEAKDKEKRRVRLKAVTLRIESEFDALRAEIGSGGATSSCQPSPPVVQQDNSGPSRRL